MIVLDEQLAGLGLETALSLWYNGKIVDLRTLRKQTVIKDEAVPTLLRRVKQATFITIDATDFWKRIPADRRYCIVCFALTRERTREIPHLLRQVFKLAPFKTKNSRMGKVARVIKASVQFYSVNDPQIHSMKIR